MWSSLANEVITRHLSIAMSDQVQTLSLYPFYATILTAPVPVGSGEESSWGEGSSWPHYC